MNSTWEIQRAPSSAGVQRRGSQQPIDIILEKTLICIRATSFLSREHGGHGRRVHKRERFRDL